MRPCALRTFLPSSDPRALEPPALARLTSTLLRVGERLGDGRVRCRPKVACRSSATHPQSRPSAIPRSRRRDLHLQPCWFFLCCVRRVPSPCPVPPYSPRSSALFAAQSPLEATTTKRVECDRLLDVRSRFGTGTAAEGGQAASQTTGAATRSFVSALSAGYRAIEPLAATSYRASRGAHHVSTPFSSSRSWLKHLRAGLALCAVPARQHWSVISQY